MTNTKNFVALGAAVAMAIVSLFANAQEDLDNLLKSLEGETAKPAVAAEEPKAEAVAPVAEAEKPAEEAKAEEPKAEEPAKAEESTAEVAETAAESVAEEKPAEEAKVEEQKAEEPATAEEATAEVAEAAAESVTEEKPAEEAKVEEQKAEEPKLADADAELIENIRTTEKLRREALDRQAARELQSARQCRNDEEYEEAIRHYGLALKLLNDRSVSKELRKECDQGIADCQFYAALQMDELGRRAEAIEKMEKARELRHPKARRMLAKWAAEAAESANARVDNTEIKHRLNDADYKSKRDQIRKHLRRSNQYLAVKDLKKALEECEIVLVNDPSNADAIRIRKAIQSKRKAILQQERVAARDGMITDVDEAWRPVYAVNAAQFRDSSAETVKKQTGEDPERTIEQEIERRMKEMRLPTISFKPPATIIDAVDFFRGASKDYDRPNIPLEKRGFNFVLKTPQGALKQQAAETASDDFSSNGSDGVDATSNGLPPIPTITASDITFYEALKLVCDSVDYKFIVRGSVVTVMHKDMSTAEILSRKYDVLDAFLDRMTQASDDVKQMRSQGFGGGNNNNRNNEGDENQEKDWKGFFEQMGVKWPEGSSIMYIKTLGKLYVRNTRENLAEFEKVLQEMGSQPKLIEIETRFVEVSQEDLNSLGFEWILNSDYTLNVGDRLGKALGLSNGIFGSESGTHKWESSGGHSITSDSLAQNGGRPSVLSTDQSTSSSSESANRSRSIPMSSSGSSWIKGDNSTGKRNLGINAFGGTSSDYNHGNRYISDIGNHISGSDSSNNDQFMRVNAFLGAADLSMILHMLSQRSDTDLLSAPKVVTKSGENAVIKVVTEYIYPQDYDVQLQSSGSSGSSSSGNSQSAILAVVEPQNFTMREVGVILDVTPTYSEANGGTIDLELKPSVVDEPIWHNYGMKIPFTGNSSSATIMGLDGIIDSMVNALNNLAVPLTSDDRSAIGTRVVDSSMGAIDNLSQVGSQNMTWYDAPMEQPFFHVRSIDSKVSITPGSTVVMGGLITEARKAMDDKIPFLGDLPFIGRLFRSHAEQTVKRNLLIFVTGRLITPSGRELSISGETADESALTKAAPEAE